VRFVAPTQWHKTSWWPRFIFENTLYELEILGPFYFEKDDMKCKAYLFIFLSPPNSSNSDLILAVAARLPKLREITLAYSFLKFGFVGLCTPHDSLNEAKDPPSSPGIYKRSLKAAPSQHH